MKLRWARVAALLIGGIALLFLVVRVLPFARDAIVPRRSQSENLRLAKQFAAAHESEVQADARFKDVRLVDATIRGGCVGVIGRVASEDDNRELRRFLMAQKPPVELWYQVDVGAAQP